MIENNAIKEEYFSFLDRLPRSSNRERRFAVNQFLSVLEESKTIISNVTSKDLLEFVEYLMSKDYSANTTRQRFALTKTFMKWCFEREYISKHPDRVYTSEVKRNIPGIRYKMKDYISIEDMEKLFSECKIKYRSLFMVMYNSLARVSAIEKIKISDIDFENRMLRIFEEKTQKENLIPLSQRTLDEIKYYIQSLRKGSKSEILFVNKQSGPLSIRSIQRITKRESLRILKKKLTPHCFRHASITHMLENDASPASVSKLASHASINTTMLYFDQSQKHRQKTMMESHPIMRTDHIRKREDELKIEKEKINNVKDSLKTKAEELKKMMEELLK